jgi:probable addiction module antidote protein
MGEKFTKYEAADYLKTPEDVATYLELCFEEAQGDPAIIAAALGTAARACGMTQVARDTGLTREGLYKALSAEGNPSFSTIVKVLGAMGLRVTVQPMERPTTAEA